MPSFTEAACFLLRCSLVPLAIRRMVQRNRVTVLLYHHPKAEIFADHVAYLERAYNLVSLGQAAAALSAGGRGKLPPRPLVITFDDGHASNRALLETFERMSARPTIFLCSGIVGTPKPFWFNVVPDAAALKQLPDEQRLVAVEDAIARAGGADALPRQALSEAEVGEMGEAVDFQAHTISHPVLPRCPDSKAREEIFGSKVELEQRLGLDVDALAYPNGDYTDRDAELASQAGYRCALTVDHGFNTADTDPFRLKRIAINEHVDSVSAVAVKACGLWGVVRGPLRSD